MAKILPWIKQQFFDENGEPLAGGKIYSYIAGTSTPLSTYSDPDGLVPNANPVILDASGEGDIYLGNRVYKIVITDSDDVVLDTRDDVDGTGNESNNTSPWAEYAITDGQAATDLDGETIDFDDYSQAIYDVEIIRGTTVCATGTMVVQSVNGTGRVVLGGFISEEEHGVTFSISQDGTVAQLRAAADSGAGNGTVKLSRRLVPA